MTPSWQALRKEARRIETKIDTKLLDYSKVAATFQSSSSSTRALFKSAHLTPAVESLNIMI